jgi:glyoxylase-like metal-dependent hydrolase (beta-lactamase superfamily II)
MKTFKVNNLVTERYIVGPLDENTYLVYEENAKEALLIDPGSNSEEIAERIKELNFEKLTIFLTHGHGDHIAGVEFFRSNFPNAKLAISIEDAPLLQDPDENLSFFINESITIKPAEITIKEGDTFKTGSHIGIARHVPGHTRGGMVLIFDEMVFSGDTLFCESVGRSDFPGGDGKALVDSIKSKILTLTDRIVLPGHGPETTVQREKSINIFF